MERVKQIPDPIYGTRTLPDFAVDIASTRIFSRLHGVLQTSNCRIVFPNMTHTRYAHSIGVFLLTYGIRFRSDHFRDLLDKDERKVLSIYALVHDIGHTPFSHILEPFGVCHKKIGFEIVEQDKELDAIFAKHKIDKDFLLKLMQKGHPLYKIVTGGLLSSDKLDYLVRDTHFSGNTDFKLNPQDFLRFIYFDPQEQDVYIDKKKLDLAKEIVSYYIKLYGTIYLRKTVQIADRMLHKAIETRLKSEGLSRFPDDIIRWTDGELFYLWLRNTKDKAVKELTEFYDGQRNILKPALVVRHSGALDRERAPSYKHMLVVEDDDIMRKFQNYNPFKLSKLEDTLAERLSISSHSIAVVPNMFGGDRFKMPSLKVGTEDGLVELAQMETHFANYIKKEARKIPALRVVVPESVKSRLLHYNDLVLEALTEFQA